MIKVIRPFLNVRSYFKKKKKSKWRLRITKFKKKSTAGLWVKQTKLVLWRFAQAILAILLPRKMGVFADLFWNVVRFPVVKYLRKQDQLEASLPQIYISNSTNSGHYSNGIFSNIFSTFWYGVSKRHVTLETRLILIAIFNLLAWKKGKESQLALRDKKPPSAKILCSLFVFFLCDLPE